MSHDDIERKRVELEMSLANEIHMSDKSKYELIRKIIETWEEGHIPLGSVASWHTHAKAKF